MRTSARLDPVEHEWRDARSFVADLVRVFQRGQRRRESCRVVEVQLEAARLLTYRAAWRLGHARNASLDASMTKLFVSESLVQAALATVQVHGGYGFMTEYEVERALRDAVGSTLYSGPSEMQRNIIARWLGL